MYEEEQAKVSSIPNQFAHLTHTDLVIKDTRFVSEKATEIWSILKRPGSVSGFLKVLTHASIMKKAMFFTSLVASGHYRDWSDLASLRKYWVSQIAHIH